MVLEAARTAVNAPHPLMADDAMAAYDAVSVSEAIDRAHAAFPAWTAREVDERAGMLERLGDSLEEHRDELMALCIQEAFKSIPDAIAAVREAVDFCRYYAARARADLQSRSEEHTSELQSLMRTSYAVSCLKYKQKTKKHRCNT